MIHQLTRDDLVSILTEPKNALVQQFKRFFQFDGIDLVFAEESLQAIADNALERETGARGLRSILEETCSTCSSSCPPAGREEVRGHQGDDRARASSPPWSPRPSVDEDDMGEQHAESA